MPDTRPVWLTREQIAALPHSHARLVIEVAWDAAPADAVEALCAPGVLTPHGCNCARHRAEAEAALRALGMPGAAHSDSA